MPLLSSNIMHYLIDGRDEHSIPGSINYSNASIGNNSLSPAQNISKQNAAPPHHNPNYATMRPLSRPIDVFRPFRLHPRYSSTSAPLINVRSIPAPHSGSIRILSLNSPRNRNAISLALLADLTRHIKELHNEGPQGSTRAVILASDVDEAFCAGADLKERRGFTKEQ